MRIVSEEKILNNIRTNTRTVALFNEWMGTGRYKTGVVARMKGYESYSAITLTDKLMNIYYNEKKPAKFQAINSMAFEWDVQTNFIKKILIVSVTGNGQNGSDITFVFRENYYDPNDVFSVEGSRQRFWIRSKSVDTSTNRYVYTCTLQTDNPSETVDTNFAQANGVTRWRSVLYPEISERGYYKMQSNFEKHRNFMSRHRHGVRYSAEQKWVEEIYLAHNMKNKNGKMEEKYFKLRKGELEANESFMFAKNDQLLFGRNNHDKNGVCMMQDNTGQDIPSGDGIVPQIERYAGRYTYSLFSTEVLRAAMTHLASKADTNQGNTFMFICNVRLWNQVQVVLDQWIQNRSTDGTFLYSKGKNGWVDVGATYNSYEIFGNKIMFMNDRAFDNEYSDRGYGILIDIGPSKDGQPAIQGFSLAGKEFEAGYFEGFGLSKDNRVSSPVTAGEYMVMGLCGCAVFNPYRSFIIEENLV